ncbi:hypothetical protein ColKHC_06472 [Colletotrichum higginsianum]|nr:hypothetical protein ColKHC_06472 [Colletotrichum higginsianum]
MLEISYSTRLRSLLNPSDPHFFDYWIGKSWQSDEFLTSATFLQRPVTDPDETFKVCEKGWNCSAEINFVGPAYKCQELARGVGATPRVLQQQSGNARLPFDFGLLAPKGNHTWIASATLGEYHDPQLKDVEPGGIPTFDPPFPKNLGAFRTEPVMWVGGTRSGFNAEAWRPNAFACEHYEARYTAELRYRDGVQLHAIKSRQLLDPIVNTTFQGHIPAVDGTEDNTAATPEENYVLPRDTLKYRRTAAYHSLGLFLRNMINGTISEPNTNASSFVIQTGLIDQRLYNARPNMVSQLEKYYETLVLSMLVKPRFLPVVWASKPDEQTGIRDSGLGPREDYMYPCQRERAAIKFYYRSRILFNVYGAAIFFTILGVTAGALALRKNDGVPRNTDFSSIVAATRGSHLGKVPWNGVDGDSGAIPEEVMSMKMGYGRLRTAESNVVYQEEGDDRTDSPKPMPRSPEFGFGFEGDLDQTCGSKA